MRAAQEARWAAEKRARRANELVLQLRFEVQARLLNMKNRLGVKDSLEPQARSRLLAEYGHLLGDGIRHLYRAELEEVNRRLSGGGDSR